MVTFSSPRWPLWTGSTVLLLAVWPLLLSKHCLILHVVGVCSGSFFKVGTDKFLSFSHVCIFTCSWYSRCLKATRMCLRILVHSWESCYCTLTIINWTPKLWVSRIIFISLQIVLLARRHALSRAPILPRIHKPTYSLPCFSSEPSMTVLY